MPGNRELFAEAYNDRLFNESARYAAQGKSADDLVRAVSQACEAERELFVEAATATPEDARVFRGRLLQAEPQRIARYARMAYG